MDERRFTRLESSAALASFAAWEISSRNFFMPDLSGIYGYRLERSDLAPYRPKRIRKADPVKASARKRQRKARAKTRKAK